MQVIRTNGTGSATMAIGDAITSIRHASHSLADGSRDGIHKRLMTSAVIIADGMGVTSYRLASGASWERYIDSLPELIRECKVDIATLKRDIANPDVVTLPEDHDALQSERNRLASLLADYHSFY